MSSTQIPDHRGGAESADTVSGTDRTHRAPRTVANGGIPFRYAQEGLPRSREPLAGDASTGIVTADRHRTRPWTAYRPKKAALRGQVRRHPDRPAAAGLAAPERVEPKVRTEEPEPFRRLGVHGMYATYRAAGRRELATRTAQSSRSARGADRVAGR